jgi:hypothetical protein
MSQDSDPAAGPTTESAGIAQREHLAPIQWCSDDLCRTLEEWR